MNDEKRLEDYRPGQRVVLKDGREGKIITAPTIGATGAICFGVRLDDGSAKIAAVGRDI